MTTPQHVLDAQAAYAARPWLAYVSTSHFAGGFRFNTQAEAIAYIFQSAATVRRRIESGEFGRDWVGFDGHRSFVEGPGVRYAARWALLQDDIQSHR